MAKFFLPRVYAIIDDNFSPSTGQEGGGNGSGGGSSSETAEIVSKSTYSSVTYYTIRSLLTYPSGGSSSDATEMLNENYNSYSYFKIDSAGSFYAFKSAMWLEGLNFSGKTVFLTTNINWSDVANHTGESDLYNISGATFSGTFDGQGYYINFHQSDNRGYIDDGIKPGNFGCLFDTISSGATVKNVEVKYANMSCSTSLDSTTTILGVIAGENNGTIDSCIVNYCHFMSNRENKNCKVASITGKNTGTVKNCIVKGVYSLDCKKNKGIKSCYFVVTGNEAQSSLFLATVSKINTGNNYDIDTPSENGDTALDSGKGNYNSADSGKSEFSSSIKSTTAGPTGTEWYVYPSGYGYSGMSIYLRPFITWGKIQFDCNGDKTYETSRYCVYSSSADEIKNINEKLTSTTISLLFDSSVTAYLVDYDFVSWVKESSSKYYATFKLGSINISFATESNAKLYYKVNNGSFNQSTTTYTQTSTIETQVAVSYSGYGKANYYSTCQFTFTNYAGNTVVVKYEISNATYCISAHQYKSSGASSFTNSTATSFTVADKRSFCVATSVKSYNTYFQ